MKISQPRTILLNIPPSEDCSESIRAHALTIHGDSLPTRIDWAGARKRRGVRPFFDEERVTRVEQQLGNAAPSAPKLWSLKAQTWRPRARAEETSPICVSRVDNIGPVIVRGAVNSLCEFMDERSSVLKAYRRTILQRGGEVEPTVARSWLVRDFDMRCVILACTKEPPEPAELGGSGCQSGTRGI